MLHKERSFSKKKGASWNLAHRKPRRAIFHRNKVGKIVFSGILKVCSSVSAPFFRVFPGASWPLSSSSMIPSCAFWPGLFFTLAEICSIFFRPFWAEAQAFCSSPLSYQRPSALTKLSLPASLSGWSSEPCLRSSKKPAKREEEKATFLSCSALPC